jgi:glycosyltransferase involved in cell wall biosynthesis
MKIVFHSAYVQRMAGANRSFYELVSNLDKRKYNCSIAFPSDGPVVQFFKEHGIKTEIIHTQEVLTLHNSGIFKLNPLRLLKVVLFDLLKYNIDFGKYLKKEKVDILHCRDPRSLLLVGLGAKIFKIPVICHIRGDLPSMKWLSWAIGIFSDRIVLVNSYLFNQIPKRFHKKCRVVYNSISKNSFNRIPKDNPESGNVNGIINIVTFANIIPEKGFSDLLDAAKIINQKFTNIQFFFVGSTLIKPDYAKQLENLIKQNGLNISITGWCENTDKYYEIADIIILPTLSEGFPRTLLEAMYLCKPVIATAIGGIPELVVDDVTGFLVDPKSPYQIAEKIIRLVQDRSLMQKLGCAGKERVLKEFNTELMIKNMDAIYQDVNE